MEPLNVLIAIVVLIAWFVTAAITAEVAREKGRVWEGAVLAILWGPLGLLCVCALPRRNTNAD